MKKYINPPHTQWAELCRRPVEDNQRVKSIVSTILERVRTEGDTALVALTKEIEGINLEKFTVSEEEWQRAKVSEELATAIDLARENIAKFHQAQVWEMPKVNTQQGVTCWQKNTPIEKVGLYIPGGTAPLFSTLLMLGVPAQIAKCKEIILCTPPNKEGKIHPAILYVAKLLEIEKVYKIGGAQAVGAMTFGTETIPKVDKIFGPGNAFVTEAKSQVQLMGTAIDMPAGPSELLVIADKTANAEFVAADLLSQAEHGVDSQVILVSDSQDMVEKVQAAVAVQLEELPRKEIAEKSLQNGAFIVFDELETVFDFSNVYAPEHLIIQVENHDNWLGKITQAGSVFLGKYTPESAGDYASGTNHTLPTSGFARTHSGVTIDSFCKRISFQEVTSEGIKNIGSAIEIMAENEQLQAHKNAVTLRLKSLEK